MNRTKQALGDALLELLAQKPLEKITIEELTTLCQVSRMTFYYHFRDIYDLVDWICIQMIEKAYQQSETQADWNEGLVHLFRMMSEKKEIIANLHRSVSHEAIEKFWRKRTYASVKTKVEKEAEGKDIEAQKIELIIAFCQYGLVGIVMDWFEEDMPDTYEQIVRDTSILLDGYIQNAIQNLVNDTYKNG